jgi:hydroxymethylglutaryl-CoA lyase
MSAIKLIECPRDAMQGLKEFIPTRDKVNYLNQLLTCGFDTLDFGSFVSPKAIPQMRDTAEVLEQLTDAHSTKLLAIVANLRGSEEACTHDRIDYLGFPFSVSEEFQQRNTNSSIEQSLNVVEQIKGLTEATGKKMVVYISMGFGNPYGEKWNAELVHYWCDRLYSEIGVEIIALSDTIGAATPTIVSDLFQTLIPALPDVEFGAHLHTRPENAKELLDAAWGAGCRRFDGAIGGIGGCPMAKDDLTGNMPTEIIQAWLTDKKIPSPIQNDNFEQAQLVARRIMPIH